MIKAVLTALMALGILAMLTTSASAHHMNYNSYYYPDMGYTYMGNSYYFYPGYGYYGGYPNYGYGNYQPYSYNTIWIWNF